MSAEAILAGLGPNARREDEREEQPRYNPKAAAALAGLGPRGRSGAGGGSFDDALRAEGVAPDSAEADFIRSIYAQETGSGANTRTSHAGATGEMQIIPPTFRSVADPGWDINNPQHNRRAGIRYAMQGLDAAGGDPRLAAIHYYSGPGGMRAAQRGQARYDPINPKFPNSFEYADQVTSRMGQLLGRAEGMGLRLPTQESAPVDAEARRAQMASIMTKAGSKQAEAEPEEGTLRKTVRLTGDALAGMAAGVNTPLAGLVGLVAPDSDAREFFESNAEYWQARQSGVTQELKQRFEQETTEAFEAAGGGARGAAAAAARGAKLVKENPSLALLTAAEVTPSVGFMLAGGVMGGAVGTAVGVGLRGGAALTGMSAANAALDAGAARAAAYDRTLQVLKAQGVGDEEAKQIAEEESWKAVPAAAAWGAALPGMGLGRTFIPTSVLGRGAAGGTTDLVARATDTSIRSAAKTGVTRAAGETVGQTVEAVIPGVSAELVAKQFDESIDPFAPVGAATIQGLSGAAGFGALAGRRGYTGRRDMARQMDAALNDPAVPQEVKTQARQIIVEEARKRNIPETDIALWMEAQEAADLEFATRPQREAAERDLVAKAEREASSAKLVQQLGEGGWAKQVAKALAGSEEGPQTPSWARALAEAAPDLAPQEAPGLTAAREAGAVAQGLDLTQRGPTSPAVPVELPDAVAAAGQRAQDVGPSVPPGPSAPVGPQAVPPRVTTAGEQAQAAVPVEAQGPVSSIGAQPVAPAVANAGRQWQLRQALTAEAPATTEAAPASPAEDSVSSALRARVVALRAEEQAAKDEAAAKEQAVQTAWSRAGGRPWGRAGKRTQELFTRLHEARQDGTLTDAQYVDLAAQLAARGAAARKAVDIAFETVKTQNRIAAAREAETREVSARAQEAAAQRAAPAEPTTAPAEPTVPRAPEFTPDKTLKAGPWAWLYDDNNPVGRRLNQLSDMAYKGGEGGRRSGLSAQHRVILALGLGYDVDGSPRTDSEGSVVRLEQSDIGQIVQEALGLDKPMSGKAQTDALKQIRKKLDSDAFTKAELDNMAMQLDPAALQGLEAAEDAARARAFTEEGATTATEDTAAESAAEEAPLDAVSGESRDASTAERDESVTADPLQAREEPATAPEDTAAPVEQPTTREEVVRAINDARAKLPPGAQWSEGKGRTSDLLAAMTTVWNRIASMVRAVQPAAFEGIDTAFDALTPAEAAAFVEPLATAFDRAQAGEGENSTAVLAQHVRKVLRGKVRAAGIAPRFALAARVPAKWAAGLEAVFTAIEGLSPELAQHLRRRVWGREHTLKAVALDGDTTLQVYEPLSAAEARMLDAIGRAAYASLMQSEMGTALRWVDGALDGIGWFDGSNVRNAPDAVYSPSDRQILLNHNLAMRLLPESANDDPAAMLGVAVTMGHELGHAMSDIAGEALGFDVEATQSALSPFNVRVAADSGGMIFTLNPVAQELYNIYRSQDGNARQTDAGTAGRDAGADVPSAGRGLRGEAEGRPDASDGARDSQADGRAALVDGRQDAGRGEQPPARDTTERRAEPEDAVAAGEVQADQGWVEGLSLSQPFASLTLIERAFADGDFVPTAADMAALQEMAAAASEEAWAHALEAYLADPQQMNKVAPLTHAVVAAALKARTARQFGNVVAGHTKVRGVPQATTSAQQTAPEQVKSATGNFDPASPDIRARRPVRMRQGAMAADPSAPAGSPSAISSAVETAIGRGKMGLNDLKSAVVRHMALTNDLVRVASKSVPSVQRWWNQQVKVRALQQEFDLRVTDITNRFNRVRVEARRQSNEILRDSTVQGKWAFEPEHLKAAGIAFEVDPALAARFRGLEKADPRAAKIVKDIFKHNYDQLQEMRKQALKAIESDYDVLIEAARKEGDTAEVRKLEQRKLRADPMFKLIANIDMSQPYTPLGRFGNHVVVAKSARYLELESVAENKDLTKNERDAARVELNTLREQPEHYYVAFREGRYQARMHADAVRESGEYASVDNMAREADAYGRAGDVLGTFRRLQQMVQDSSDERLSGPANQAINQLMADLNFALLSQQSARHAFQRRETVAGFDEDMVRAFESRSRAAASFIASISHSREMAKILSDMRNEVRRGAEGTREERQDFFNEILRRHTMGMDYKPTPFYNKVMAFTSAWSLMSTPSYYMVNLTQPWAMSLPWMAGRHNWATSARQLGKAQREVGKLLKDGVLKRHEDGGFDLRVDDFNALPADVREPMKRLANEGIMLITLSNDMGRWGTDGTRLISNVMFKMRRAGEMVEAINRLSTAIAAYRLEMNESGHSAATRALRAEAMERVRRENPEFTDRQVREQIAFDYAAEVLNATHGDYMDLNRPRFMRNKLGKLLTQFRVFQLIQASMFIRVAAQSFAGASPAERAVGRRALAYTFGHMGIMGGAVGLPGFVTADFLATTLASAFGDDDDRQRGAEELIRDNVSDPTMATLLTRGVPAAFLGADMSTRLGGGTAFSQLPFTDVELSKKGWEQAVVNSLGPFLGGIIPQALDGIDQMGSGNYWKGTEKLVPRGFRDFFRAMRQGTEGVTDRKGELQIPASDMRGIESFWQAIGFQPANLSEHYQQKGVEWADESHFRDRAAQVNRSFVKAREKNDTAALAQARRDFLRLQDARVRAGLKRQPLSNLNAAWKRHQTAQRASASSTQ